MGTEVSILWTRASPHVQSTRFPAVGFSPSANPKSLKAPVLDDTGDGGGGGGGCARMTRLGASWALYFSRELSRDSSLTLCRVRGWLSRLFEAGTLLPRSSCVRERLELS